MNKFLIGIAGITIGDGAAYKEQGALYQNGARHGFHEAIGDTIALSITPSYLMQIGLLDQDRGCGW